MKKWIKIILLLAFVVCLSGCRSAQRQPSAGNWQEQYDLGVRYLSEGNYQEAILAFTAAIKIDPKQPDAYIGLADAYIGIGDYEKVGETIAQGQETCGDIEGFDRILNNLSFLQSNEVGIKITSFYFDKTAYLENDETDFLVSVAYRCPEGADCILMIGANTQEPNRFAMMDEDYQVAESGGYQFYITVTPVQWEESYFGIYVNLSEADHAETWTPFAMDVLYITPEGNILTKIKELENRQNLLEKGMTDNMVRFEEVNFLGRSIEDLDIETMKSLLTQNGFDYTTNEDLGNTGDDFWWIESEWLGTNYAATISALQNYSDDYVSLWGYTHFANNSREQLPIGIRNIYTYDTLETVLTQLGFSNGSEISDYIQKIATTSHNSMEEIQQLLNELEYTHWEPGSETSARFMFTGNGGCFILDDGTYMPARIEFEVSFFHSNKKFYQLTFRFGDTISIQFSDRLYNYDVFIC